MHKAPKAKDERIPYTVEDFLPVRPWHKERIRKLETHEQDLNEANIKIIRGFIQTAKQRK